MGEVPWGRSAFEGARSAGEQASAAAVDDSVSTGDFLLVNEPPPFRIDTGAVSEGFWLPFFPTSDGIATAEARRPWKAREVALEVAEVSLTRKSFVEV